ncbi:hypothetical protein RJZ90_001946 [Blastomyces dermatitidis]
MTRRQVLSLLALSQEEPIGQPCADVVDMVHLDILRCSDDIAFFNYRLTREETNVLSDAVDEAILRQGLVYFLDAHQDIYTSDDLDDAVEYLEEYLVRERIRTVPYSDIRRWAVKYCLHLPRRILAEVNNHYHLRFGRNPIDFST